MPAPTAPRTPNRPATEAALQRAAIELLERHGVLAGLNLREVADEAGVNRGLVYHYFGSRRDLLRAALRRDVEQRLADFSPGFGLPAPERYERFVRTALTHRQAIVLAMLLVLDGDPAVQMVPDPAAVRERLARDVEDSALPVDIDPDGIHAALAALVYGYAALRDRLADELGTDAERLDDQVASTARRLVAGLQATGAPPSPESAGPAVVDLTDAGRPPTPGASGTVGGSSGAPAAAPYRS
jgi:AcrR family transcriptional regulator